MENLRERSAKAAQSTKQFAIQVQLQHLNSSVTALLHELQPHDLNAEDLFCMEN